jgi:imidazolonepropionase-like amidohydrolase
VSGLLAVLMALQAVEKPPATALTGVRVLGDKEIEGATILLSGGTIQEVGKDVKVPDGAKVVDGRGWTALPGLIHAGSRLGLSRGGDAGGAGVTPHHRAAEEVNPALDVFDRFARAGFTLAAVHPAGGAVGGLGAVLRPLGGDREAMLVERDAFLRITMEASTAVKDALRQALEGARKAIDAEKKTPAQKPDERTAPLVRFLKGELPGLVAVSTASEILHFWQVLDGFGDFTPSVVFVATADAWKAADELGRRKARVLLRPEIVFAPFTRDRVNPAAELARAGARVGLVPWSDATEGLEGHLFRVAELVKLGLPRDVALRAITTAPAEFLGLQKRFGAIEKGKEADLLLFDGDPLSAGARLRRVYLAGREAFAEGVR